MLIFSHCLCDQIILHRVSCTTIFQMREIPGINQPGNIFLIRIAENFHIQPVLLAEPFNGRPIKFHLSSLRDA